MPLPNLPPNATTTASPELSPEEIHAEIQAVLHSSSFERSEKLQNFLRFICDLTLRGEGGRINEYLIGSEVFRRGADYSPSEDSVVRRQAHTLRQKLQDYYNGEGSTHTVRIDLPVGRYVPVFRCVREQAPPVPQISDEFAVVSESPAAGKIQASTPKGRWALAAFGALALLGAGYFWGSRTGDPHTGIGPATREIWGPWIRTGREAVICYSSPMTAVIKRFEAPLPPDQGGVPRRTRATPAEEEEFRAFFRLPAGGAFYFSPAMNQTKTGEAAAGVHLATILTRLAIPVKTARSYFVNWETLRGTDMILLGHNEANSLIDPLLINYPFRLTPTEGSRPRAIVNTKPQSGEAAEYIIDYASGDAEGDQEYALISMIPGMTADQRLLLINGLNAQATQAAAEYLANESSLAELLERLRASSPGHTGPWHFQAVFKAEVHDKVPTRAWLVAVRVL